MHIFTNSTIPPLFIVGLMTVFGFYVGKSMKYIRLPTIIGFMIAGVILGTSGLDLLNIKLQSQLSFLTDIALGFVAVSIGLELNLSSLKKQGMGIVLVIFSESFMTFILVTLGLYLFTRDLALSLILGAIAPASDPAGTVATIQEYKTKGSLTNALYAVVGFDDGLGIIIFGFAAAVAKSLLVKEAGGHIGNITSLIVGPLLEVLLSFGVGAVLGLIFSFLVKRLKNQRDIFILIFAVVLINTGISSMLNLSLILTNMILGILIVNTQASSLVEKIRQELTDFMPLIFILFFVLAGASLNLIVLPALGLLGILYVVLRSAGLISGAYLGAAAGRMEAKIRKNVGLGILSQAGVAIGLSLVTKNQFTAISDHGEDIGLIVISTVTATSVIFSLLGPIMTKVGLIRGGEIKVVKKEPRKS